MHLNALPNEYQEAIPKFDKIPKAVLGAVALSFALRLTAIEGTENFGSAAAMIRDEWSALHQAGIVPQAPE